MGGTLLSSTMEELILLHMSNPQLIIRNIKMFNCGFCLRHEVYGSKAAARSICAELDLLL